MRRILGVQVLGPELRLMIEIPVAVKRRLDYDVEGVCLINSVEYGGSRKNIPRLQSAVDFM